MYGLVNKAVQELVTDRFGEATWDKIRVKAGLDEEVFISMEAYPDEITYRLVATASDVLQISPAAVLEAFGEYWTLYTGRQGYGEILRASGENAFVFLQNLDQMHVRVGATFTNLRPPSFHCDEVTENSLRLHYFSTREGLAPMVIGLVKGVGALYNVRLDVEQVAWRGQDDHDVFMVTKSE